MFNKKIKLFGTSKGFTLVELLVVIAIIGILATLILLQLGTARAKARDAKRISDISQIRTAVELYYDDNYAKYPRYDNATTGATADASRNCTGAGAAAANALYPQAVAYLATARGSCRVAATLTTSGNDLEPYISNPTLPKDPSSESIYSYLWDNTAARPIRYHLWAELERKAPSAFAADADLNSTTTSVSCGTPPGIWCQASGITENVDGSAETACTGTSATDCVYDVGQK